MKRISNTARIILGVGFFMIFVGCKDFLEKAPLDSPSSLTFPNSRVELDIAVTGVYNSLYKRVGGNLQDELFWDNVTDLGFVRGSYESSSAITEGTATTRAFESHWAHYYKGIQRANFILERMPKAREQFDKAYCDRVESEVKFIRAYHYMHLTEKYGDVPLVTSSLELSNSNLPRTSKSTVADMLISDLNFVAEHLEKEYAGNDWTRITKGAAYALLSRIALYNGRYADAIDAADKVIKLGIFQLHDNYGQLFTHEGNNSKEIILKLPYHVDVYQNTDHIFLFMNHFGGWSITVPTQYLVDSYLCKDGLPINTSSLYQQNKPFENRDPRLRQSLIVPGDYWAGIKYETHPDSLQTTRIVNNVPTRVTNGTVTNQYASFTGYQWRKYADERQLPQVWSGLGDLPLRLIRYGEVLLNFVEAKIEENQLDDEMFKAFNAIRRRADMPEIDRGLSQNELRKLVRLERKIELAGEGYRLYDIRRWKIAEHVMVGNLPGRKNKAYWWNPGIPTFNEYGHPVYSNQDQVFKIIQVRKFNPNRDYLWAIPQGEMDLNDQLVQNPNY